MSKTFTSILVPVDFSVYATESLLYAASIAKRFFSSLTVLHVISKELELHTTRQYLGHRQIPMLGPFSDSLDAPAEAPSAVAIDLHERALTALQKFLPPELKGLQPELLVRVGIPFEQILTTATEKTASLIVMGTHGRSGLSHTVFGSVAERVVRLAPCPVLTVKANAAPSP
jgi:universal stress protein A